MARIEPPENPQGSQVFEGVTPISFPSLSISMYGELIKSKQTFLLLYTAVFAYLISAWPIGIVLSDFVWLIIGLFFAISGSTLLNMYIDRDIDALMERTKDRPLPSGRIAPSTVLNHGLLFTTAGILAVGVFINFITMAVVFLGFFFDVVVYSLVLKRRTRFSIIFGGIAGGLPAIAGRTAVTDSLPDMVALLMGLFIICWIPLHILTLSLIPENLQGYRIANIPIWHAVRSHAQTIQVITFSALLCSLQIVITGFLLRIHPFILLLLSIYCLFIISNVAANFKSPSNARTKKIFKMATMFMVFAFLSLFVGVVFAIPL